MPYEIIHGNTFISDGGNTLHLLSRLVDLDVRLTGDQTKNETYIRKWTDIFETRPENWALLAYDEAIVGYVSMLRLSSKLFDSLLAGSVQEDDITVAQATAEHEQYEIFVSMMLVEPQHRPAGTRLIVGTYLNIISDIRARGTRVGTVATTPEGRRMAIRRFQMLPMHGNPACPHLTTQPE